MKYLILIFLTVVATWSILFWVLFVTTREVTGPLSWRPDL